MGTPTSEEFRRTMAHLPTGVTIVSAHGPGGPAGATANAVVSTSLEPPLMLASLDRGSRTRVAVQAAGAFGISVLRSDHAELARSFASRAPHTEKWREIPWRERGGVPILDEALVWIACGLRDAHDAGDHVLLIGSVLELGSADGDPLVFHRGAYRGLDAKPR
ncbi:MAG TPA: flavin reductase family protein [Solirubrobacterales bacterium]|jgi:3-hydroxy-9,10-secoandrosta-1,3,5(10)-triene-9,17-dione monooxygenase reductase component|nr:flavin reductase family protein [Solirubrobacterales bacterium]